MRLAGCRGASRTSSGARLPAGRGGVLTATSTEVPGRMNLLGYRPGRQPRADCTGGQRAGPKIGRRAEEEIEMVVVVGLALCAALFAASLVGQSSPAAVRSRQKKTE